MQASNPLFDMKQLISLQASSVRFSDQYQIQSQQQSSQQNSNFSHQLQQYQPQSSCPRQTIKNQFTQIRQSIPKLLSQVQSAKQQILSLSFATVNRLMSNIHIKNKELLNLKIQLQKSKETQVSMKQEVIQLKDMINEFVNSYSKQISSKEKQILSLKDLMKKNFSSPRNICKECQNKIRAQGENMLDFQIQSMGKQKSNETLDPSLNELRFRQSSSLSDQILIVSSVNSNRMSLEVIQEESEVNTTIDYQHSIRESIKSDKIKVNDSQTSERTNNLNISSRLILPPSCRMQESSDISPRLMKQSRQKSSERRQQSSERKAKKFIQSFRKSTHQHQNINQVNCDSNKPEDYNFHPNQKNQGDNCNKVQSQCLSLNVNLNLKSLFFGQKPSTKNYNVYHNSVQQNKSITPLSLQKLKLSKTKDQSCFDLIPLEKFQFVQSRKKGNKSIQNIYQNNKAVNQKENYYQSISRSSSSSDILHFGDTDKINLPLKQQTPKNMLFLKKKTQKQRLMTEPSPRALKSQLNKQNMIASISHSKISQTSKKIFARKRTMTSNSAKQIQNSKQFQPLGNNSNFLNISYHTVMNSSHSSSANNNPHSQNNNSQSNSRYQYNSAQKSSSSCKNQKQKSKSKQKIKVTSKNKIIQDFNQYSYPYSHTNTSNAHPFKKSTKIKGSVHLGGKFHFKKILFDIKQALKKFEISTGQQQVKFQGSIKDNLRQGFGKIIYQNGLIYEGQFKNNKRNGQGKLVLNGVQIFSGEFNEDKIQGQGYIKSMRFMTEVCLPILNQASYYGKIQKNKLQGMGTLFLNKKQKIVTKFTKNMPYGELTYYTGDDIQFGVWGSQ